MSKSNLVLTMERNKLYIREAKNSSISLKIDVTGVYDFAKQLFETFPSNEIIQKVLEDFLENGVYDDRYHHAQVKVAVDDYIKIINKEDE